MVFSNIQKRITFILIFILFSSTVLALGDKESCTPDPCPSYDKLGYTVTSPWDSSNFNTTLGGTCVKDGGDSGDYCVRNCEMALGCYGEPELYSNGENSVLDEPCAFGKTSFVNVGETNLNTNYCYFTESVSSFDTNSENLFYNWYHYINLTNPGLPFFYLLAGTNNGGDSLLMDLRYIYQRPQLSIPVPTESFDFSYPYVDTSFTESRLTITSGCTAGATYDLWAEHTMYRIPIVTNEKDSSNKCLQNAQIDYTAVDFQLDSPETPSYYWDWLSPRQEIIRPTDNEFFVTIQWVDDGQDNGDYSSALHQAQLTRFSANPGSITLESNFTGLNYACTATSPVGCAANAQFYVNISDLPDGDVDFFVFIDDGFESERPVGKNFGTVFGATLTSTKAPSVTLNSPADGISYEPGTTVTLDYTTLSEIDTTLTNTILINNAPVFSGSQSNGTNTFNYQFNETGTYNWKVQSTDSYGINTSETRTIIIEDASLPTISSTSVNNVNVGQNLVCSANVNAGSYPIDKVWCELNPQSTRINMNPGVSPIYQGSTLTSSSWATNQNWVIYANDTQGYVVNRTGTVQINHNPTFVSKSENPSSPTTYGPTKQYTFTSTWADDIGTASASITFVSGPLSGQSFVATKLGNTYTRTFTGLNAGIYNFYWTVTDNGGLQNTTPGYSYVINKATPTITNTMSPSFTVTTGTVVTGSCTIQNNTGGNMIYNKCGIQTSNTISAPGTISMTPTAPSIGTYTCNCSTAETTNWNAAEDVQTLTIQTASSPNVSNLEPTHSAIIDVGDNISFNATVTSGSFPLAVVAMQFNSGAVYPGMMTSIGSNIYQKNLTMLDSWPTYLDYEVIATDTGSNSDSESVTIINNHAPTINGLSVSPEPGQAYSPTATYTFNASWSDDLDAVVTTANITIDGTEYSATHLGDGNFTYSIVGLSTGVHNYTWTAWDSRGLSRTTSDQEYSVGVTRTILQIFSEPSVSVVQGTQTTVNCTANVPVSVNLYRNGVAVSNPDIQTLSTGTYNYVCNTTGGGNYTAASTSDVVIVNPRNSQTQGQFCDGQFSKQYTYENGSENYTMCVNLPCGANITSAKVNLTGLPLFKLLDRVIGFFRLDLNQISSCTTTGASFSYYYRIFCNNTDIYMNGGRVEMVSVRLVNSTLNNTIYDLPLTYSNVKIENAYVLNGELISGTITSLTDNDEYGKSTGLYNITFDT